LAGYIQDETGAGYILEQNEWEKLTAQSTDNPDQIALEDAIK